MTKLNIVLAITAFVGAGQVVHAMDVNNATANLFDAAKKHDTFSILKSINQKADVNAQDAQGNTPLHYVLSGKMSPMDSELSWVHSIESSVAMLVNHGANPHIKNIKGISPMEIPIANAAIRSKVQAQLQPNPKKSEDEGYKGARGYPTSTPGYSSHAEGYSTYSSPNWDWSK